MQRNGQLDCAVGAVDGSDGGADECEGGTASYPHSAGILVSLLFSNFYQQAFFKSEVLT